jgi:hypothetical protein
MGMTMGSIFFYGGVAGLGATIVAAVIVIIVQSGDRKRLRNKLDAEYGKAREALK